MRIPTSTRGRTIATALAAAAVAGAAAGAIAASGAESNATASASALPAAPPTDASAARMTFVNRTVNPGPTSTRGFTGFQTYVVRAPANRDVLQGFATLSGGNTGSAVIRSTRTFDDRFVVKLEFPGEQGEPGKLHVRVQLIPKS